jgi:hypothetical protein
MISTGLNKRSSILFAERRPSEAGGGAVAGWIKDVSPHRYRKRNMSEPPSNFPQRTWTKPLAKRRTRARGVLSSRARPAALQHIRQLPEGELAPNTVARRLAVPRDFYIQVLKRG